MERIERVERAIKEATVGFVEFGPTMLSRIAGAVIDEMRADDVTADDREYLRYALGVSHAVRRPVRNHYLARPDDERMAAMVERGLMRAGDTLHSGWQFFHATEAGAAAIGHELPTWGA